MQLDRRNQHRQRSHNFIYLRWEELLNKMTNHIFLRIDLSFARDAVWRLKGSQRELPLCRLALTKFHFSIPSLLSAFFNEKHIHHLPFDLRNCIFSSFPFCVDFSILSSVQTLCSGSTDSPRTHGGFWHLLSSFKEPLHSFSTLSLCFCHIMTRLSAPAHLSIVVGSLCSPPKVLQLMMQDQPNGSKRD